MNVLFTCVVGHGHFHPMVPLAHAFREAGHRVAFATDPGFCAYVRGVGFEAFPAGLDQREALHQFEAATPGWTDLPPEDRWQDIFPGLFARVRVPPMLEDLAKVIAAWPPDLLIHDTAEMAGAIAAEVAGIAHVEHSFGILRPTERRRLATEALRPISQRLGVRNPGVGGIDGELYLDVCPPGLQQPEITDVPNVQGLRPMGFDAAPGALLPGWIAELPPRPTVYVTLGTVFNTAAGVFRTVLDGLRDEPFNVIVTVGADGDPALLGAQPDNVHVERYIPQSELLPLCALLVSHAGSGAMLGAANAGVPMLAIPQGADQFLNAERIVEVGLGLRVMPAELSPLAVRSQARQLISADRYASVARTLQQSIVRMPTPRSVVVVLENLVS